MEEYKQVSLILGVKKQLKPGILIQCQKKAVKHWDALPLIFRVGLVPFLYPKRRSVADSLKGTRKESLEILHGSVIINIYWVVKNKQWV